jgi:hypothetical protein
MSADNKLLSIYNKFNRTKDRPLNEVLLESLDLLTEAQINNIYKGLIYLDRNDANFLNQFPPRYWAQALYQRYHNYLWDYLSKLQDERDKVYLPKYKEELEDEMKSVETDSVYASLDKKTKKRIAMDNARHIAKQYSDRIEMPFNDNPSSPFDFVGTGRDNFIRVYANPHVEDLYKKLEGAKGKHDGFDLHNPVEIEKKASSAEGEPETRRQTDGFLLPEEKNIQTMIRDYIKLLGHKILPYNDEDLIYQDNNPDESKRMIRNAEYKSSNLFKDTMTYELLEDDLFKRAKAELKSNHEKSDQKRVEDLKAQIKAKGGLLKDYKDMLDSEGYPGGRSQLDADAKKLAKQRLESLIKLGKIKSPESFEDPSRERAAIKGEFDTAGNLKKVIHPDLVLPHKKIFVKMQKLKKNADGNLVPVGEPEIEEHDAPIIVPGTTFRRLKQKELNLIKKVESGEGLSENEEAEYKAMFGELGNHINYLRGSHYDYDSDTNRPIFIDSWHEPSSQKQGAEHYKAGGLFPAAESPERVALGKYNVDIDSKGVVNKYQNEAYAKKVAKMFGKEFVNGMSLKQFIRNIIYKRLASKKFKEQKQDTMSLALERSVLLFFLDQLVEMGMQRVIENFGLDGIEESPSIITDLVSKMMQSIEQQDLVRGSRRRRKNLGQMGSVGSPSLQAYANSYSCNIDPEMRRLGAAKCGFKYRIGNLIKSVDSNTASILSLDRELDDTENSNTQELLIKDLRREFSSLLMTLAIVFYRSEFESSANKDSYDDHSFRINKILDAEYKVREFVESLVMRSESSGGTIDANMFANEVKNKIKQIESTIEDEYVDNDRQIMAPEDEIIDKYRPTKYPLKTSAEYIEDFKTELKANPHNYIAIKKKYDEMVKNGFIDNSGGILEQIINKLLALIASHTSAAKNMNSINNVNPKLLAKTDLIAAIGRIKGAIAGASEEEAKKLNDTLNRFELQNK